MTLSSDYLEKDLHIYRRPEDLDIETMFKRIDGLDQSGKVTNLQKGFTLITGILETMRGGSKNSKNQSGNRWSSEGLYDLVLPPQHQGLKICLPLSVIIGLMAAAPQHAKDPKQPKKSVDKMMENLDDTIEKFLKPMRIKTTFPTDFTEAQKSSVEFLSIEGFLDKEYPSTAPHKIAVFRSRDFSHQKLGLSWTR